MRLLEPRSGTMVGPYRRWTDYDPACGQDLPLPAMRFLRAPHEQLLTSASVAALPYEEVPLPRTLRPWQWGWRLPRPQR